MFVLLAVAAVIALFNVVSILMVSVDEKKKDVKILFSMGLTPSSIVGVFLVQGVITGMMGVVLGVLLGYFLASNISEVVFFLENILQFKIFPPEIFYISEIPSVLLLSDFLIVTLAASFLSMLAPFYPALRVARRARVWRESL
jgi:lipoprotein-releasing system permease protein